MKRGFTLLELMITVVLFIMLALVTFFIFRAILLTWSSQETRAGKEIILDFSMEKMVRDLREAEVLGFKNPDEIRFTQGLNDDTDNYIYYLYNSNETYPPDFDEDSYELRKATLASVTGRDLSTGTFTYGDGAILIWDVLSPNDASDPSDLSFRVPEPFYYVMHAGDLYSSHDISFQGSSGTVTGNLSASDNVQQESGMTINGTIYERTDSNTTALMAELTYYGDIADTSVSGNSTFNSAGSPYSGIYYIDGDALVQDNVTINGSLIATGAINLRNTSTFVVDPTYPYPALAAGTNINASGMEDSTLGDSTKGGLIYAGGNIDLDSSQDNTFYGTLVAGGDIIMTSSSGSTFTYDSDIQEVTPPYFYYSTINLDLYVKRDDETVGSSTEVRPRP